MAPENEADWESGTIIERLAGFLNGMIEHNAAHPPAKCEDRTRFRNFYSTHEPPITVRDYLIRIAKYAKPGAEAMLQIPCHLRALADNHDLVLTKDNVHRLIAASTLLSAKIFSDAVYVNPHYAKIAGFSTPLFNLLELELLVLLDFHVHSPTQQLLHNHSHLRHIAHGEEEEPWRHIAIVAPAGPLPTELAHRFLDLQLKVGRSSSCSDDDDDDNADGDERQSDDDDDVGSGDEGEDRSAHVAGDDGGGQGDDHSRSRGRGGPEPATGEESTEVRSGGDDRGSSTAEAEERGDATGGIST